MAYLGIESHGGECCGRRHLFEFGYNGPSDKDVEKIKELLDEEVEHIDYDYGDYEDYDTGEIDEDRAREDGMLFPTYRFCIEVTLTKQQAEQEARKVDYSWDKHDPGSYLGKTWDEVLTKEFGFKKVYAFTNPNTNNIVYVYLRSDNEEDI